MDNHWCTFYLAESAERREGTDDTDVVTALGHVDIYKIPTWLCSYYIYST